MKDSQDVNGSKKVNLADSFSKIFDSLTKGAMLPKDAAEISNSYLESLYSQAYRLYNTGKYKEGIHIFQLLILLNSNEPKYLLGLAASFHMLKDYAKAIQVYTHCSLLEPENPIPYFHSADCFLHLKDSVLAMISFELAVKYAEDKPEFARLKERAILNLEAIKEQIWAKMK